MTMSEDTEPAALTADAKALADEIRRHASVLSGAHDLPEVAAAINAVRVAARRYVANVMTRTGWSSVFANLEQDTPAHEKNAAVPDGDQPIVSYRSRYRLRIHDYEAARGLLEARYEAHGTPRRADFDDSHAGVIAALAELDGWDPYDYDQDVIEVVSACWEAEVEGKSPAG
jgi:hypothetical protein